MRRRDVLKLGLAASATALAAPSVRAQAYPSRPVKLVVPFAAGGVNDIVGRQWAEKVKGALGNVYVENHGGGGGTIGVMEAKRQDADGHTVLFGSASTMVLNEMTRTTLHYDPRKDFVPIAVFCVTTASIAVHPSVPAKNLQELVAHIKANAGKLTFGSAGTGTMSHLTGELFKLKTGLKDLTHVPYKGAGPGMADLVSGHIPIMSPNISKQVLNFHDGGKIRVLAAASPKRLKGAPTIPTGIEQGIPDFVGQLFLGIFVRAGTPKPAIDKITEATRAAMADAAFEKFLLDSGFEPVSYIGADAGLKYMAEEFKRWKPVVDAIGLKV
ncbi:MAG: tripartite tricarboxylate transporter substrate binding protein [Alphaproteobacteria bacterium]|nr:tripartite tricarboxylate transporter substrate binding protein [Alphaproteobacteria bacterium]